VHRANCTKDWFESNSVSVLSWPAKFPDLNIIENVWGAMVRLVYKDGRHFENLEELVEAVASAWESIELDYIRNLYRSIPRQLISVIEKKGLPTRY